jgi:hypothetical protein
MQPYCSVLRLRGSAMLLLRGDMGRLYVHCWLVLAAGFGSCIRLL